MRIYLFYNIWNKAAHVPWLCEGIRNCFPQNTMRDGIDFDNSYFSSNFSFNAPNQATFLKSGEYKRVRHVNDGPLLLSRQTINKVGLFTEDMWMHYVDTDYSYRCLEAGLNNYVMGAEVIHEKWGCRVCGDIQASEVWGDEFSKHDHQIFRSKWPT